ncbi:TPA: miniconductance mechanosensitive channel MscM [Yersinia enterocolitica]|uniref:Potassium efflux system KefA protein; Small-conductance mechanosensitive channel n=2 Tax=Enterobacterales TaxID=91347 RepID=A0ABM9RVY6_YEREN|nr:miniconductance mechanosensitive channel MscM [Yersinia enterocolitica]CFV20859.1 potassium efflux system KefA protein%3B Small-conductance mechanosensitive channel [Yersinia enterocolitica]CND28426.1 potassium efflux system KefA protein%3B Small-conductance mechanosensitive channel [Yersinia enterocolitica]CNE79104.1 potassium efflux system KefA protein%3B Small-conductance mechanosensitive channel [Yersinia enterocolitica]CQD64255.1 potassium efflux system KefA protein%3B Small-conductance
MRPMISWPLSKLLPFGLLLSFIMLLSLPLHAATQPNEEQIRQELKQAEANKGMANQAEIVQALQGALSWLADAKESDIRAQQYQKAIDDFPKLTRELRQQLAQEGDKPLPVPNNMSTSELEQQVLQISSQLLELSRLSQQEQDRAREISESLNQLPQQQSEARRILTEISSRLQAQNGPTTPAAQAQLALLQAEAVARKAKVNELELSQLSANNRQELSRLRAELYKKRQERVDTQLQALRNTLNNQRQQAAEQALERTELLAEQGGDLPASITQQLQINRELSQALNQQAQRIDLISSQQRQAVSQTQQVRQALSTIREQAQWLGVSTALGEALRAQVSRLPDVPKSQQLDRDMAQLRVQRLQYEDMLEKLQQQNVKLTQDDGTPLTTEQQRILDAQWRTQRELLNSLLSGYDTQILELTKLKVANSQLVDALSEVREATHRYLFWVADVSPISLSYPVNVAHDLTRLLSLDTLAQLSGAFVMMMMTNQDTLLPIIGALLFVGFSISSRRHYHAFLERASSRVGKVTQDHFSLTLRTVFWSILVALPLPVLWAAVGYGLQNAWSYPMAIAIGNAVTATVPVLWVFMISASFAHPHGLFITHFRWSPTQVGRAMRFYRMSVWLIIPLMMALITFENYNDREFAGTLGRLCFILLCIALSLVTNSLKRAGIPLYLDKKGSGENIVNVALWGLLLSAPLIAALASALGYLTTSQALLARLETSVAIWFFLLVVYHIIRRWMLIQRRRIAFDRAKQRRADILAQRARGEDDTPHNNSTEGSIDVEEPVIDLDVISAQSLRLVRSILTMIALVSVIVLWSEIHSAFGFLENIRLWDVSSTINGIESVQAITMGSLLIAILVMIVTTQLVRNLPALLELALLQHLDLTPGTGYAISTITKYLLILFGSLLGFSMLGIEWAKFQWLVAALGLGLGFGLQEIFANFVSGLIILFEKPIRIGDTVTIRDLTGSVTKINTRATTISDWDRKEIIVPNKAFITEQFINWSLSDSITRVVLTVPAPAETSSEEVTEVLLTAARRCTLVLDNPPPEVYLVDLQQGIQIFELRIYAAEMGHRMPLRHEIHQLILAGYREHGITLPFPPFQARLETLGRGRVVSSNRSRTPGSL